MKIVSSSEKRYNYQLMGNTVYNEDSSMHLRTVEMQLKGDRVGEEDSSSSEER